MVANLGRHFCKGMWIKYFIIFSIFQNVVLVFLYAEQDVNLAWQSCFGLKHWKIKNKLFKIRKKVVLQMEWVKLVSRTERSGSDPRLILFVEFFDSNDFSLWPAFSVLPKI